MIPEAGEKVIKANRQKVLQALRRVAILTSDRNKGVNVQINPGKMEFTATHPDLGTARDVVEVEYQGDEFEYHHKRRLLDRILRRRRYGYGIS